MEARRSLICMMIDGGDAHRALLGDDDDDDDGGENLGVDRWSG